MKVVNPTGKLGEDIACEYVKKHGYKLVERNFHAKGGEVDIIAIDTTEKSPVLCFIEVKTRTSLAFGTPFEAISYHKLRFITHMANYYTILHKNLPTQLRIDGIAVTLDTTMKVKDIVLMKNISG